MQKHVRPVCAALLVIHAPLSLYLSNLSTHVCLKWVLPSEKIMLDLGRGMGLRVAARDAWRSCLRCVMLDAAVYGVQCSMQLLTVCNARRSWCGCCSCCSCLRRVMLDAAVKGMSVCGPVRLCLPVACCGSCFLIHTHAHKESSTQTLYGNMCLGQRHTPRASVLFY